MQLQSEPLLFVSASQSSNQFRTSIASRSASFLIHAFAIAALLWLGRVVPIARPIPLHDGPLIFSVSEIRDVLAPPNDLGGGGGNRNPLPASIGELPHFAKMQLAPPTTAVIEDAKLEVPPTLVGVEVKLPTLGLDVYGDPLHGVKGPPSDGPSSGGGIGSGSDGGVGPGKGPGAGPGSKCCGFSTGNWATVSGASQPQLIYSVEPEFTDEARKMKYQGTVEVNVVVDANGRVQDPHIAKALGFGLDERVLAAVTQWKFKPGMKDGRPVAVNARVLVTFRLL